LPKPRQQIDKATVRKFVIFLAVALKSLSLQSNFGILNNNLSYMYAIVEIAGQQFKVQKDQKVFVHRLDAEAGKKLELNRVLLVEDAGKVTLGAPAIEGAKVTAEVLEHVKGDKVIVFKKKRRKGYRVKNGHRQQFTAITIKSIKA
jgi:large subunit ribosomal protein L21